MVGTVQELLKIRPPKVAKSTMPVAVCSNPDLIVGLELETENVHQVVSEDSEWLTKRVDQTIWNIDRDGSLRGGDTAFEFISKPLPLGLMLPELQKFLTSTGFDQRNYSDRCSVHVHTNVVDFSQRQLSALALVYPTVEDILFKYVNTHKAPTADGYSRDTNIYCIPWTQCRMNSSFVTSLFADPSRAVRRWEKYTALNLLPIAGNGDNIAGQGSVEWRHMHGTADFEKLSTWLNLIGSIMAYAKNTDYDEILKTIKNLNDTSAYRQYYTTVLGNALPYDDTYAGSLAAGVINAKMALITPPEGKSKKFSAGAAGLWTNPITEDTIEELWDEPLAIRPAPPETNAQIRARVMREVEQQAQMNVQQQTAAAEQARWREAIQADHEAVGARPGVLPGGWFTEAAARNRAEVDRIQEAAAGNRDAIGRPRPVVPRPVRRGGLR